MKNVTKWEFTLTKVSDKDLKFSKQFSNIFMRFTHLRRYYYDELFLITLF